MFVCEIDVMCRSYVIPASVACFIEHPMPSSIAVPSMTALSAASPQHPQHHLVLLESRPGFPGMCVEKKSQERGRVRSLLIANKRALLTAGARQTSQGLNHAFRFDLLAVTVRLWHLV
jgi:hypothetical protein